MALPRAAPPNWPDVEAPPIVRLGKCQGETKRDEAALPEGVNSGETYSNRVKIMTKRTFGTRGIFSQVSVLFTILEN